MAVMLAWIGINVIAFLAFGWDKRQAARDGSRIAERTLIGIALFGGALGALVGQQVFRHKTRKQPFRTVFWCTVLANCAALAWFLYGAPPGLP